MGHASEVMIGWNPASEAGSGAATWCQFRKLEVCEFDIFNFGLVFGSLEWGALHNMEITLDGLIWDSGVFNYGFGYV